MVKTTNVLSKVMCHLVSSNQWAIGAVMDVKAHRFYSEYIGLVAQMSCTTGSVHKKVELPYPWTLAPTKSYIALAVMALGDRLGIDCVDTVFRLWCDTLLNDA